MKPAPFSPFDSQKARPEFSSWSMFLFYTRQYARRILLYLPIPVLAAILVLDYLPARSTHDFMQTLWAAFFVVMFALFIAFIFLTFLRLWIVSQGSSFLHRKLQTSWWFHAIIEALCFVIIVVFFQYIWPAINPHAMPFSQQFPNTLLAMPLIALAVFLSFHNLYIKACYKELQSMMAEAQHEALKTQMQPHFLFNSLNDLSELIEIDPARARGMMTNLAHFYGEVYEKALTPSSTLKTEIAIIQKYLELTKIRFGQRLQFEIKFPEAAQDLIVPSLMLQTLVENAVKHGIGKSSAPGFIRLEIEKKEGSDLYRFQLTNSGKPFDPHAPRKGGTGVANTLTRLRLVAGDRHSFRIAPLENGTIVEFFIPQKPAALN